MAVKHVNKENFQTIVMESDRPVLIDFWAPWCGPCKMFSPVIDEIGKEQNDVEVVKINIDEEPELAKEFRVMSIPTVLVMKDGKKSGMSVGVQSKQAVLDMLKK